MSRANAFFVALVLSVGLWSGFACAIDALPFKDRAQEVRFQQLTRTLRCLVCQNQDLGDSDAELARDLRRQVFDMMQSGKTDQEIKQYLVDRYNDFVLYDPPLKPGTMLLWFGPAALFAIGAVVLVVVVRRRGQVAPASTTAAEEEDW
jgi:cytochrome c-type biogenesis protein CcmH